MSDSTSNPKNLLAFTMSQEVAMTFMHLVNKYNLTEDQRLQLLLYMAKRGMIDSVVESKMSEDEYVAHLRKNFDVVDGREEQRENQTSENPTQTEFDEPTDWNPDREN